MITRVWHGRTAAKHADEYLQFLQASGIKEYKATPGNLSTKIWRRIENDICHFYTVTEWDAVASIQAFAGHDYEKARYYPEDKNYLLGFEETVSHYETFIP